MDLRRAQRNLELISHVEAKQDHNDIDEDGDNNETRFGTGLPSTQVPHDLMAFTSSGSEMENENENKEEGNLPKENSDIKSLLFEPEQGRMTSENHEAKQGHFDEAMHEEPLMFMNTQIQSRLDDAEEESRLKLQLNHFKYSAEENEDEYIDELSSRSPTFLLHEKVTNLIPLKTSTMKKSSVSPKKVVKQKKKTTTTTRRTSKRSTNTLKNTIKNITQFSIENFEKTRSQNLLKQLSGKHKKVQDIIKLQDNEDSESSSSRPRKDKSNKKRKSKELEFDTYNCKEWEYISNSIIKKFPHCEKSEMKQVFTYLYGGDVGGTGEQIDFHEDNAKSYESNYVESQGLWVSSQLAPREVSQPGTKDVTGVQDSIKPRTQSVVNVLSLSQVMEDKTEASIDNIPMDDHVDNVPMREIRNDRLENISIQEVMADPIDEIPIEVEVSSISSQNVAPININKEYNGGGEDDDISIVSDSMEESANIIPIRDTTFLEEEENDEYISNKKQEVEGKEQRRKRITIPELKGPFLIRDDEIAAAGGEEEKEIIDLTQEPFKVVDRLISPLRSFASNNGNDDNKENGNGNENENENEHDVVIGSVQVPASRTTSVLPATTTQGVTSLDANGNEYGIDNEWENIRCLVPLYMIENDDLILADTYTYSRDETVVSCSDEEAGANTGTIIIRNKEEKKPNIIESQSVQKLRDSIRSLGLKPVRSKSEMIESLQLASSQLGEKNSNQDEMMVNKKQLFEHITKIVRDDEMMMDKIICFEPILIQELLERLIKLDPFIEIVDTSTIREWADSQGVCLKNR
ncbi:Slx4p NDAI_0G02530 [Naumovozyma dairenensis CBS 421]|uniref:Structure-specific endonuclease subunit SLX4 n=1 Tax=Naumovozyma dairenensis (strain ATCC 10597 / BCRC 20456 / CBS 421 / NBRC 0211 / NRRL Y-12639) TaxID=1071378 RepID=G0WE19_NAUDC|nr:hypothetical protein NDAI_0G02530 [Naumovozyma dairenensis CBS 421]CCD26030.2 hypothetical protein NDAI_0G02530 [Naumovozyma dairenensis CBS 421]